MVKRAVKDSTELAKNFQINADLLESAADLHTALTIQLLVIRKACDYHLMSSRNSIFLEAVILSLLSQGNEGEFFLSFENFRNFFHL